MLLAVALGLTGAGRLAAQGEPGPGLQQVRPAQTPMQPEAPDETEETEETEEDARPRDSSAAGLFPKQGTAALPGPATTPTPAPSRTPQPLLETRDDLPSDDPAEDVPGAASAPPLDVPPDATDDLGRIRPPQQRRGPDQEGAATRAEAGAGAEPGPAPDAATQSGTGTGPGASPETVPASGPQGVTQDGDAAEDQNPARAPDAPLNLPGAATGLPSELRPPSPAARPAGRDGAAGSARPYSPEEELGAIIGQIRPRARPGTASPEDSGEAAQTKGTPAPSETDDCLDPGLSGDADIRRNLDAFVADPDLCLRRERFVTKAREWELTIVSKPRHPAGPSWIILRDDDDSAFDTALYAASRYGGTLVAAETLEAPEAEALAWQDPRLDLFEGRGAHGSCRSKVGSPLPKVLRGLTEHLPAGAPVLSILRPGTREATPDDTAQDPQETTSRQVFAAPASGAALSDVGGDILIAGRRDYENTPRARAAVVHFGALGIGVIYEELPWTFPECSLAARLVHQRPEGVYGIVAQSLAGMPAQRRRLTDALMAFLGVDPLY
ncbi:hypothetical protein ACRARG_14650 [Pseudooceanicola sp. C21-150M6]|uniref:hypothetical protein n=1 Tax=Pseudooceanicola sp. C21-150M6 TaxID=3434355 RepID=UPI003D7FC328